MKRLLALLTWLLSCLVVLPAAAQGDGKRVAVVVGANAAAPGRKPLRFAHDDARALAATLEQVGGLAPDDVDLLLDPDPGLVLATLDARLKQLQHADGETLLLFYYSGHADAQALYPKGQPLELKDLKTRLDSPAAKVRLGIVDTCRGGGWTGTRGFSEAEPFQVDLPFDSMNEGSVMIASSSGLEDAHESAEIQGGFFTHHWIIALRGAADRNADGVVSVTEAFEYAKRATIRDTALRATTPQHPSFRMELRGRQDLPLARLAAANSLVEVDQSRGPLQLIHLDTGLLVLQLAPGQRRLKLAIPPGRYLVRTANGPPRRGKEVAVRAGATTSVSEAQLELVGEQSMAIRASEPRPVTETTLPNGAWLVSAALGVRHGGKAGGFVASDADGRFATLGSLAHAFSDRLTWVAPLAVAYRFGHAGAVEWVPWGGLMGLGVGSSSVDGFLLDASAGLGLDSRWYLGPRSSLNLGLGAYSEYHYRHATGSRGLDSWQYAASVGYSQTLADTVTLNVAAELEQYLFDSGELAEKLTARRPALLLGGVQSRALRPLPLIQVHLNDVTSLDAYAGARYDFAQKKFEETYMAGASFVW